MGARIDVGDGSWRAPLLVLAEQGRPLVAKGVQALIKKGAKADVRDRDGATPLMFASRNGNVEAMEILLGAGASPNAADSAGRTPLLYACQQARDEAVKLLLDHGALPGARDLLGDSVLMHLMNTRTNEVSGSSAVESRAPSSAGIRILELLLKAGFDPRGRNLGGRTELHQALASGQWGPDFLAALVKAGCDPRATDNEGADLLATWAGGTSGVENLKFLSGLGLDPNRKAQDGLAPIHLLLARYTHQDPVLFQSFLDLFKPDIHLPGRNGAEPLAYAAGNSGPEPVRMLVKAGAHVSHRDAEGDTPLAEAMLAGKPANLLLLLEAGAKPEDAFRGDWEAVAREVKSGKAKACFANLAQKDEACIRDKDIGAVWTQGALLAAALKGDVAFLQAAEAAGVDLSVPWRKGLAPLDAPGSGAGPIPGNRGPVQAFAEAWNTRRQAAIRIRIDPECARLGAGTYHQFVANVPNEGTAGVKWSIEGSPSDASIDAEGQFTATRAGRYRIQATSVTDTSVRGEADVMVVPATRETAIPAEIPRTHGCVTMIQLTGFRALQVGGWDGAAPMTQVLLWDGAGIDTIKVAGKLMEPRMSPLGIALDRKTVLVCNGAALAKDGVQLLRSAERLNVESGESKPVPHAPGSATSTYYAHCGGSIVGLPDGSVLLIGGDDGNDTCSGAERFNPRTGRFELLDKRPFPVEASAVSLEDGRILIFGGRYLRGKEKGLSRRILCFDPRSRRFTAAGSMLLARAAHASIVLSGGQVLISGGCIDEGQGGGAQPTDRCEVFDPATGKSREVGRMSEAKAGHAAGLMVMGQVLTYGGLSRLGDAPVLCATMETYDPHDQAWEVFDHPRCGIVNPVLFPMPDGSLFHGGSMVEFDPAKRDKPEDGVKPAPRLCDRVMM